VGTRAGLDVLEKRKILFLPGIKPNIVQLTTYYTELLWLPILTKRDKSE
jgi:hypothetical protein